MSEIQYAIGIDVGTHTGVALAKNGELIEVFTTTILDAMSYVKGHKDKKLFLVIEDARKLRWGGYKSGNAARLQGAGSVKRDCTIWEEFATREEIPYMLVDPRANYGKLKAEAFKRLTGYTKRTNEHGRDAAMLVYGRRRFVQSK